MDDLNKFKIWKMIVRTSKEDSAFFYFTLEANENICFYSTLGESMGKPFRDIEIGIPYHLRPEFMLILNALMAVMEVQILSNELLENKEWDTNIVRF